MSTWTDRREAAPRSVVERAQDELLAGRVDDPRLAAVRPLVVDSWSRSLAGLVNPGGDAPLDLDAEAVLAYRAAHPLADVMQMIRSLLLPGDASESGVVVAVGDAAGRLMWVEGDAHLSSLAQDMGFTAGANWSEAAVGTAAPGTALAVGRSVQIRGPEHFKRLVQPWSCTASPVRDPETRAILGVLDVTGGAEAASPQAQLLVDATARAVESELLVRRLQARAGNVAGAPSRRRSKAPRSAPVLRVLGREGGQLDLHDGRAIAVGSRHAELLLMLATHREGLRGEQLADLVYGDADSESLRPELVRLKKLLRLGAPGFTLESRPYRLNAPPETDVHQVFSLLDRGAHRVAQASYVGDVLPGSQAPGIVALRDELRQALREALMAEGSADALLAFADTAAGEGDREVLMLCLKLLPSRSPRRAGVVRRIEALERDQV